MYEVNVNMTGLNEVTVDVYVDAYGAMNRRVATANVRRADALTMADVIAVVTLLGYNPRGLSGEEVIIADDNMIFSADRA